MIIRFKLYNREAVACHWTTLLSFADSELKEELKDLDDKVGLKLAEDRLKLCADEETAKNPTSSGTSTNPINLVTPVKGQALVHIQLIILVIYSYSATQDDLFGDSPTNPIDLVTPVKGQALVRI